MLRSLRPKNKTKRAANPPESPVQIVVGLRNPGADYDLTRHNVGYEVVDAFLARSGESLRRGPSRIRAQVATLGAGDGRTVVLVPTTYMNESGRSVRAALDYFKLSAQDMLVVHDDIDLPFGRLRLQVGGGSGGHNGIRSLESAVGTRDFSRLKLGVGRPPGSKDPADYVLERFSKAERSEVDLQVQDAADVVDRWLSNREAAQEQAALRQVHG